MSKKEEWPRKITVYEITQVLKADGNKNIDFTSLAKNLLKIINVNKAKNEKEMKKIVFAARDKMVNEDRPMNLKELIEARRLNNAANIIGKRPRDGRGRNTNMGARKQDGSGSGNKCQTNSPEENFKKFNGDYKAFVKAYKGNKSLKEVDMKKMGEHWPSKEERKGK